MKQPRITITIRMPKELGERLQQAAEADDRSQNSQILRLLRLGMQVEASRQPVPAQ